MPKLITRFRQLEAFDKVCIAFVSAGTGMLVAAITGLVLR